MALFGTKKTKKETAKLVAASSVASAAQSGNSLAHVLSRPRITEKATDAVSRGVYVFDIAPESNKRMVMQAVSLLYKVMPRRVTIVTIHPKRVRNMRTGRVGVKQGGKKAYVYLKEGDTITLA